MDKLEKKLENDLKVLRTFIGAYCNGKHATPRGSLCADCAGFLAYAESKRRKCPLNPKPACKHCPIHCYSKERRALIREVMAYSGRRLMMRGRLDLVWHYFF